MTTKEIQKYDYLIDSHINGNFSQCRELFKKMTKQKRKEALIYIDGCYGDKEIYKFYFNLL